MVVGLFFGEYFVLVVSGVLDFEDVVVLVVKCGVYMEEAVFVGFGKMVVVFNMLVEVIEEVC